MASASFSYAEHNYNNEFYFGGPAGVSFFNPEKIITNNYALQVILTNLKIKNKIVEPSTNKDDILSKSIWETKKITLDYDMANFSITFAIPNFVNASNNQYSYRLVGLENQWITSSNTEATFTIQNPGTYTFEVKGANNNGIESTFYEVDNSNIKESVSDFYKKIKTEVIDTSYKNTSYKNSYYLI